MDSSINTAKPYKEKTFRSKLPVRKPRAKKTPEPTTTSLITNIERQAIRAGQARLVAETEQASASTLQRAMRSKIARTTMAKMKAENISYEKIMNTLNEYIPTYIKDKEKPLNVFKLIVKSMVDYANKNKDPQTKGFVEGVGFVKISGFQYAHMNKQMKYINEMPTNKTENDVLYIKRVVKDINDMSSEISRDKRRSSKPDDKMKAESETEIEKIEVPVPKTKKEKKPKYKISYAAALKEWNMGHNRGMWCNPRVGTDDHKAVIALRL